MPVKSILKEGNFKDYIENTYHPLTFITSTLKDIDLVICNVNKVQDVLELTKSLVNTKSFLVYISTNKFYKQLPTFKLDHSSRIRGIPTDEECPFEFDQDDKETLKSFTCESLVREFSKANNINSVIIRPGCIVGYPLEKSDGFLAKALLASRDGTKFEITGQDEGLEVRDQLHIKDFISSINEIVNRCEKFKGEIFNIGGGINNSVSILELLSIMQKLDLKPPKEIVINPKIIKGYKSFYVSDISKLCNLTYTQYKYNIVDIIKYYKDEF